MSGGLRQAIPNHKRSLHARIKEAETLLSKAIPTNLDERQDHIDELSVKRQVVATTIDKLASIDKQWLELMSTIKDEKEAEAEHVHYANTASHEKEGYHELLERADHIEARLNTRIARLEKSTNLAPNPSTPAFPPAAQGTADPGTTPAPRQLIHLPKLSLPVFDGNILKFPEFWSLYNATVHSRTDITPMTKLAYLMPQLTGAAERAVEGYPKTDEYYEMIIKRLKERFEHTDDRFTSMLHAELKRIPSCSPKTEDKRRTLDACERIFRQLEQCGDELDPGRSLVFDLLAKFPHSMIKELERHYKVGVYSKLSDVRTTMEKCITEEEMTYGFLRDLTAMKQQDSSKDNGRKSSQQNGNGNRRDYQNHQEPRRHEAETTFAAHAKRSTFNRTDLDRQGQPPNPCYFCGQRHFNYECKSYPSAKSRLRRLQQLGRCNRCLINHGDDPCRRNLFCPNCNTNSHNKTLCFKLFPEKDNRNPANIQPNRDTRKTHLASAQPATTPSNDGQHAESLTATEIANFSNSCTKNSLFQTAKVTARNLITGEECKVRICLDTLSNRTYITEKAARMLKLPSEGEDKLYVSVFGTNKDVDVVSQIVSFGLQQSDGKILNIEANTTRIISNSAILPKEWPASEEKIIRSMGSNLADDPFDTNKYIDVLIGADYTWQILQGPKADLRGCDVFLIPSVFGLMLGGQLNYKSSEEKSEMTMFCFTESTSPYPSELGMVTVEAKHHTSYPDIDEFWNLETVGIMDSPTVDEDQQALQNFKETVIYQDGRYHAKWPWIPERKVHLPSNYNVALKRFQSLTARLLSEPELLQGYRNTITQQIEKGVIEKVPPEEVETINPVHYLPHHPVLKQSSATTKLRIVYDASAKQQKHDLSLNECLLRGPVLLPDLCQLLIRFRLGHTVIISDVEKAFLQVGVQPEDRDVNRFLWYEDDTQANANSDNIAIYRFARVAFGIVSSPFILGATILHHLEVEGTSFAKQLKSDIYVDNIISSLPDGQSALDYYHQIKDLFRRAGMNVQEFCSNSKQLMSSIPQCDRMKNLDTKVLGVRWDSANDDTLRIARSSKFEVSEQLTKRKVLQAIAAVFDPLGLFQPATFPAKLFLQKLWFQGETWDSALSPSLGIEWQSLRESLESVFEFRIPRYIGKLDSYSSFIVFSDASGKGYGSAVYLRTKQSNGGWSVNLIFAKSRLAPHHPPTSKVGKKATSQRASMVSLPRLELLGVVVAVAAASFCRDAVQLCDLPVTVFTDSECVLHWIKSDNPMKLFVERRVEKIRALTNSQFRYVSTSENPADLLTRGCTGAELVQNDLWWHGPPWLTKPMDEWPETRVPPVSSEASKELKVVPVSLEHTLATVEIDESVGLLGLSVDRYSELPHLLRVTWQQLRFLKLFLWSKQPATSRQRWPEVHRIFEQISTDFYIYFRAMDYQAVLKMWIRVVQSEAYSEEIATFQQQRGKKMSLIQQLNLRMDDDGLLRACGRFQHADLPESTRNPVLLPKDHAFTKLVIQDVHAQLKHAGPTHTLSEVRRTYWVPKGRNYINSVVRNCSLCKRFKYTHEFKLPPMPPWPAERVSRSAPFQFIGLDYFGPLKVRVGKDVQKMWASIFTCLATRAIHLEPVTDCTPSEFYHCLKRFIARRGFPQQVFSDNAAYFQLVKILADKSWKEVPLDKAILTYSAQHGIEWKFITALAPWQGGHYERLVGVVKSILKTTVGRRLLSWTDLITLLAEVEAIVNSRPITYVNSEVDYSFRVLRPVDFLLFRPVTSPPPASTDFSVKDLGEGGKHLASLWKSRERYLQKLWSIWYDEYLQNLRERQSIFHRGGRTRIDRIPVEGEVVILREDDLPRGSWKLARVTKLIPSLDARVRVAEIQLANGYKINRAVSFLIPLEASEQPNKQAQQAEDRVEDREHNEADIQQDETDDSQSQSFFGFSQEDVLRTVHLLQLYDEQHESQQ